MVCSKTLSDYYWHIPKHSCVPRSDLENFYVKWQFPGLSWKLPFDIKFLQVKKRCTNVIQQYILKYTQYNTVFLS